MQKLMQKNIRRRSKPLARKRSELKDNYIKDFHKIIDNF